MRSADFMLTATGEPNLATRLLYTQGDCWILAFELGLELNAPLLALVPEEDSDMWDHVVVDLGRETVLDVEGLATRDEITDRWTTDNSGPMRLRELGRHHSMTDYLELLDGTRSGTIVSEEDHDRARAVARALVALHLRAKETA